MAFKKKRGIPDRWTDYQALGKRIPGTRFIAFKVPLQQSLIRLLPASEAFGPSELLRLLEEDNQELGLIIDLTFTTRYYKSQDLPPSVQYLKIYTAGHEVPSDSVILSFKRAVQNFLRENERNEKLVGVHCTHGLNRTGYLVCRYLIDVDGMDPGKAIELFNRSRGHSIERENYLQDLHCGPKRSNQGMEDPEQEPVQGKANLRRAHSPQTRLPRNNGGAAFLRDPRHDCYILLGCGPPAVPFCHRPFYHQLHYSRCQLQNSSAMSRIGGEGPHSTHIAHFRAQCCPAIHGRDLADLFHMFHWMSRRDIVQLAVRSIGRGNGIDGETVVPPKEPRTDPLAPCLFSMSSLIVELRSKGLEIVPEDQSGVVL